MWRPGVVHNSPVWVLRLGRGWWRHCQKVGGACFLTFRCLKRYGFILFLDYFADMWEFLNFLNSDPRKKTCCPYAIASIP